MLLSKITSISIFFTSVIAIGTAHYCEWGLCSTTEYCCGDNECCTKTNEWLLIGCLLTGLIILSAACACIYKYYCQISPSRQSSSAGTRLLLST